MDLLPVQKILGHYSIRTTARYTHLTAQTHELADARIEALMGMALTLAAVIPAKAGIQSFRAPWIPAFAGMTGGRHA